jgi:hypothetical protein
MTFRYTLVLVALSAPALFATTSYSFGTNDNVAFETTTGPSPYNGVWTENDGGTYASTEQIVCVVALTNITNTCGDPGPGSAQYISIPSAPSGTPGSVTNYLEDDGDPQYGAPVSTNITGLTSGDTYEISFYQASNEEDGNDVAYDDSWQVYIIPGSNNGTYTPSNTDLVYTSPAMDNAGAVSTPWEQEAFTFVANATSYTLEFVTHVTQPNGDPVTTYEPPFLDLAAVESQAATPEPGTWFTGAIGVGLLFIAVLLRRRAALNGMRGAGR